MYIYTYIAERAPKSAHTWHACTHWHRITCITHLYNTRIWVYTHLDTQVCSPRGHGADALDTQYVYTQFTQYVYTHFDTQVCSPRGHGADDRLECLRRLPKPGCPPPRLACYGYILACPSTCCDSSALMYPAKDDTAVEGARLACYVYILACPGTCCDSSALMYPAKDDTAVEGACKSDRGLVSAGLPDGFTWQAPQCETPDAPNYWHQPGITSPPIRASCNPLVSRLVFTAGLVHAGLDQVRAPRPAR